jgi:plasmid stabilization system protein ParE
MAYSVVFTQEARAQLIALYRYIEIDASPAIAQRFTELSRPRGHCFCG